MIQTLINHVAIVVDRSASMGHLSGIVTKVFDQEIVHLRQRSQELGQETRVSVYLFNERVDCLVFDMDVMRMPSLTGHYRASGMTALIDGTMQAIDDMQKLPELYGDHAFLVYVLTDGEENQSRKWGPVELAGRIKHFRDNWTVACMVPNARGAFEAKKFGFPPDNVQPWDTGSQKGLEKAGQSFRSAMDSYMTNRSHGIRQTKSFFKTDMAHVSTGEVASILTELVVGRDYRIFAVHENYAIREYIDRFLGSGEYVAGSAYYELTKPETVQSYKKICVRNKQTGKVYGGAQARQLLSIPDHEVRVRPGDHGNWQIFVQSTSVNRKLLAGTEVLVLVAGVTYATAGRKR